MRRVLGGTTDQYSKLCDDQQRDQRSEVKNQKEDFEYRQERIHHDIELLLRYVKPCFLCLIDLVGHELATQSPEKQQTTIDDRTPHEEVRKCGKIQLFTSFVELKGLPRVLSSLASTFWILFLEKSVCQKRFGGRPVAQKASTTKALKWRPVAQNASTNHRKLFRSFAQRVHLKENVAFCGTGWF